MKTQVVEWNGFFSDRKKHDPVVVVVDTKKIARTVLKKEVLIKVAVLSLALIIGMDGTALAAPSSGIDVVAEKMYRRLLNVGKWVIIVKGGIDTIQNAVSGDLQGAKKNFLSYLLVYVILWALPWGLKQVDVMFKDMEV